MQHLLLDVLEDQASDEMRAVLGRVEHEQGMLWRGLGVLVARGDLEHILPQLGVVPGRGFSSTRDDLAAVGIAPAPDGLEEPHEHVLPNLRLGIMVGVIVSTKDKSAVTGLRVVR